jgi:hypothetical protein
VEFPRNIFVPWFSTNLRGCCRDRDALGSRVFIGSSLPKRRSSSYRGFLVWFVFLLLYSGSFFSLSSVWKVFFTAHLVDPYYDTRTKMRPLWSQCISGNEIRLSFATPPNFRRALLRLNDQSCGT